MFVLFVFIANVFNLIEYFSNSINSSKSFLDPDIVPFIPSFATKIVPFIYFSFKKLSRLFLHDPYYL